MENGHHEPERSSSPQSLNLATYPTPRLLRILASLLQQIASANDTIRADDPECSQPTEQSPVSHGNEAPKEPSSKLFPPSTTANPSPPNPNLFSASAHSLSIPSSLLCFHARNVPSISIEAYLLRILKYCPTTNEVFLGLLVYFDRMSKIGHGNRTKSNGAKADGQSQTEGDESRGFAIDSFNVHRLVIAGVTVASKFFSGMIDTSSRH
jgi:hypothetical protein